MRSSDFLRDFGPSRDMRKMKLKHLDAFARLPDDSVHAPRPTIGWWSMVLDPPHKWVYVIHEEASAAIKVGVATDFKARLESLQCGNPHKLDLLHVFPAGYDLEARIHRRLADDRIHGEWFEGPMVEQTLPELAELAQKMVDAYDGSGKPPSWRGHIRWLHKQHHDKPRRKPAEVTSRFVDPASLRP